MCLAGSFTFRLLRLAESGAVQRSRDDSALIAVMKKIYDEARGNPGVRRMRAGLAALGHLVSHKRVHRLMQAAGLRGRHPKAWKRTTIGGDRPVPAPDLIGRDFTAAHADTRWCGDVTYIKTWDGWAYLATVIDLNSRKVVGWAIAAHMRTSLVTAALDMAIAARKPPAGVIFHSDRGCQYQCRLVNFRECIHTFPQGDTRGFCGNLPVFRIAFR